jgi:hypothetical protein
MRSPGYGTESLDSVEPNIEGGEGVDDTFPFENDLQRVVGVQRTAAAGHDIEHVGRESLDLASVEPDFAGVEPTTHDGDRCPEVGRTRLAFRSAPAKHRQWLENDRSNSTRACSSAFDPVNQFARATVL